MSSKAAAWPRVRVALRGDPAAAETWARFFDSPGVEVVRGEWNGSRELPTVDVIFAESATGVAATSPATIVLGEPGVEHPFTGLLGDIVHAKRDCQRVIDAMLEPVAVLDKSGRILRANTALAGAAGLEVRSVPSRHYSELLGPVTGGGPDPIARSLAEGRAETSEARFDKLSGVRLVMTSPVLADEGRIAGLIVTLRDISDLKEQQQRLVQASKLADIGLLAGGVAHEINTPLASISLRAESLLRSTEDPRFREIEAFRNFPRYLKTIGDEVQRCKTIISGLLEFSRSRNYELAPTDFNGLCVRAVELLVHEARLRGVNVEVRPAASLPLVRSDAGQMRQVILALLRNALEASLPRGHVTISTELVAPDRVRLSVEDDGVGIAEENLARVWSPFFTTKPVGQGTGLGLAICHGIVTGHGGEVQLTSRVGEGTRVVIEMPVGGPNG